MLRLQIGFWPRIASQHVVAAWVQSRLVKVRPTTRSPLAEGFTVKHSLCFSLLLTAVCALSQPALAESTYRLTLIDGDPTRTNVTTVDDLNDRGEVVGLVAFNGGEINRPLFWRDGVNTDIGDLQGGASRLTESLGINNRGEIVGISLTSSFRPFIYSDGQIRELEGFADAPNVFPWDINLRRQVIGEAFVPRSDDRFEDDVVEFLKDGKRITRLNPLPGLDIAQVRLLNEVGVAAGSSFKQDPTTFEVTSRAVIWVGSKPVNLGVLPGGNESSASDINDFNDVVGGSDTVSGARRAFLWRLGRMTELPGINLENNSDTFAGSINNRRQIVGTQQSGSVQLALLWERDGRVFNLTELISNDDPLKPFVTLIAGSLINNFGQIVALGRDSRTPNFFKPYLLTPVR
jgi:probable HAF family extracellular repeat protein